MKQSNKKYPDPNEPEPEDKEDRLGWFFYTFMAIILGLIGLAAIFLPRS